MQWPALQIRLEFAQLCGHIHTILIPDKVAGCFEDRLMLAQIADDYKNPRRSGAHPHNLLE